MNNLQRYLDAQASGYSIALKEMKDGMKHTHWIWYIFPQIKGLGHSFNAQFYGIADLNEARAYLNHPVLGARLREITQAVLDHADGNIYSIMGSAIDVKKFRSSMTLFDAVYPDDIFDQALSAFFDGVRDGLTIKLISKK